MPHRMVNALEEECANLSHAAVEHNDLVSNALTEMWRSRLPKGQKVINIAQIQTFLAEDLLIGRDTVVGSDDVVATELTGNRLAESQRNADMEELRERLFQARSTFEGVFGAGSSFKLFGEAPLIPSRPRPLRQLAWRVVNNLTSPDFQLPPVREEGVTVDPVKLAKGIEKPLRRFEQSLKTVGRKRRHYDQSLEVKGTSMESVETRKGKFARFLEALYELAGFEVLSARLRPSSHRARQAAARAAAEAAEAEATEVTETPAEEAAEAAEDAEETQVA